MNNYRFVSQMHPMFYWVLWILGILTLFSSWFTLPLLLENLLDETGLCRLFFGPDDCLSYNGLQLAVHSAMVFVILGFSLCLFPTLLVREDGYIKFKEDEFLKFEVAELNAKVSLSVAAFGCTGISIAHFIYTGHANFIHDYEGKERFLDFTVLGFALLILSHLFVDAMFLTKFFVQSWILRKK